MSGSFSRSSPFGNQNGSWPQPFAPSTVKSTVINPSSPPKMLPLGPLSPWKWGQQDSPESTYPAPEPNFHGEYSDVEMQSFSSNDPRGRAGDSLKNWYDDRDGPYVPRGIIPSISGDAGFESHRPQMSYNNYSQEMYPNSQYPPLDIVETDSIAPSYVPSDSGYGSRRDASIFSGELVHSMDKGFESRSSFSDGTHEDYEFGSSQRNPSLMSNFEVKRNFSGKKPLYTCSGCNATVKTKSDLKKHQFRHLKPFKCDFPDCERSQGFSTSNDLERHKRSKHPSSIPSKKRFRCLAPKCKSKEKLWPRLDNFRSHLKRIHSIEGEQADAFVQRGQTTDQDIELCDLPVNQPSAISYTNNLPIEIASSHDSFSNGYPREIEETYEHSPVLKRSPESLFGHLSTNHIAASDTPYNHWPSAPNTPMDCDGDRTLSFDHSSFVDFRKASDLKHILNDSSQNVVEAEDHSSSDEGGLNPSSKDSLSSLSVSGSINIEDEENGQLGRMIQQLRERGYEITKPSSLSSSRNTPAPKPTSQCSNSQDHGKKQNVVTCQTCMKFQGRPCELKKHMKRHEKPYGCTFPTCKKTFGSKNDWKRHEVSQHRYAEHDEWRCDFNNNACVQVFSEPQRFKEHLQSHHIGPEDILDSKLGSCRIGAKNTLRFWCGFCRALVNMKKEGKDAENERFDHIDDHFMGRRGSIPKGMKEWLPININAATWERMLQRSGQHNVRTSAQGLSGSSRKRSATDDIEGKTSKSRRKYSDNPNPFIECCNCGVSSPHSLLKEGCDLCNSHRFCKNCKRSRI